MMKRPADRRRIRFSFISSNFTWGGSEDLWSETAAVLAAAGYDVHVYKNRLKRSEGNVARLVEVGCRVTELARFPFLPNKAYSAVAMLAHRLSIGYQAVRLWSCLKLRRAPDLVILSQGGNQDGWLLGSVCRRLNLPYVVVSQKASDLYWPDDAWLPWVQALYTGAVHCFFVAEHNRRLTEEQTGQPIPNASIVRNPFKVPWAQRHTWPAHREGALRLACIGRLYAKEKGQDILLRVLALDKWRRRDVTLSVYGAGEHLRALSGMAEHLDLGNVVFRGYVNDIVGVWAEHHALVLGSRAEGLPLVVVEAMLSGRVPIVTDVAGNAEVIADGETGFLAAAPTEAAMDEAMERAWQARGNLEAMGLRAAAAIRALVPADPAAAFADQLLDIADAGVRGAGPVSRSSGAPGGHHDTVEDARLFG
ncbi:MAG TPA: glycosyltransferase family 4 protein [Allosphingosinicella sp.]|jgi:glycosyltransferase involved in cell wall biosynthesis